MLPPDATLEDKIGQMFAVGFEGLTAPQYLLDWLAQGRVGGVILFARNVQSPAQLAALTESLHQAAKYPILIGIDQEGGIVARLREGFTESPGAMALSSIVENTSEHVRQASYVLGSELKALGINWDYAPVVDISYNADNPSVGTRSFGSDGDRVNELALAAVEGFQSAGVAACAKHFPGLGDTAIDTHVALPTLTTLVGDLLENDLVPYRTVIGAGIDSIMTTHTIFQALDPQHPATLSPVVVPKLLREILGFQGMVTTDCMEMNAITDHYGPAESAILAALASVDLILFSHTRAKQEEAYEALLDAVRSGRVPLSIIETANTRTAAVKQRYPFVGTDASLIRHPDHLAVMREAARASLTLLKGSLPVNSHQRITVVEFASMLESGIVESGGYTGLIRLIKQRTGIAGLFSLRSVEDSVDKALIHVDANDTLILVTRNAHLIPIQREKAAQLVAAAKRVIHVCLRNPYDGLLFPDAETILCSCGDSAPSLEAVVEALFGDLVPSGVLPVSLVKAES